MKTFLPSLGVLSAMLVAFILGQNLNLLAAHPGSSTPSPVTAQNPGGVPVPGAAEVLVYDSNDGPGSAANGILAVTGSYGIGTSVLYIIDTNSRQLSVYEARGGSQGSRRVVHVGSRRIDYDLQLESFNDESKYSPTELRKLFDRRPAAKGAAKTGKDARRGR